MVRDVLGEDDEGNRYIGRKDRADVGCVDFMEAGKCLEESEVRYRQEGVQADAAICQCAEGAEVNNLHWCIAGGQADPCEDRRHTVAGQDTDNEGDHLCLAAAIGACQHGSDQSDDAAQDGKLGRFTGQAGCAQVGDGAACQGEPDDGNGGTDDNRRHQLVDPAGADFADDHREDDIDDAGEGCTQQQACIAGLNGYRTSEGCTH